MGPHGVPSGQSRQRKQNPFHPSQETKWVPTVVEALLVESVVQVACGHSMTVALTSAGSVFTCGSGVYGQLGNPSASGKVPGLVEGKLKVSDRFQIAKLLFCSGCVERAMPERSRPRMSSAESFPFDKRESESGLLGQCHHDEAGCRLADCRKKALAL